MTSIHNAQKQLRELIELIQKLRAPDGCPWDQKQTPQDIGKYLLDESYEVLDALAENNPRHVQEELGDLLFQILFIAGIAAESGDFTLADVMRTVKEKMIRRHPHVFGNVKVHSIEEVKDNWKEIKKEEQGSQTENDSPFRSVPRSFPSLKKAQKISEIASRHGLDWTTTDDVLQKVHEELEELDGARKSGKPQQIEEEIGDLLFSLVNLCRFLSVDSEKALNGSIDKFIRRFSYITNRLDAHGHATLQATPEILDTLWNEAKEKRI